MGRPLVSVIVTVAWVGIAYYTAAMFAGTGSTGGGDFIPVSVDFSTWLTFRIGFIKSFLFTLVVTAPLWLLIIMRGAKRTAEVREVEASSLQPVVDSQTPGEPHPLEGKPLEAPPPDKAVTTAVTMGGLQVSKDPNVYIKTAPLGACVALVFYDDVAHVAGVAHVVLPNSGSSPETAQALPAYFADTAVDALARAFVEKGGDANLRKIYVTLAGGAAISNVPAPFDIGGKNLLAVKKALEAKLVAPFAEDVGGAVSRSISVSVATGAVTVFNPSHESWVI